MFIFDGHVDNIKCSYPIHEILDQSIPLQSVRVLTAHLSITNHIQLVLETNSLSQGVQQVNTESYNAFLSRWLAFAGWLY